ncbi:hypothetical protein Q0M94_25370 (plasmid) [Deinococcus radiomollis]|uniref:hypothetical protein n=1 Tax=Deinococcus radiomollis TaxID=468916 RepID=UPI0038915D3F
MVLNDTDLASIESPQDAERLVQQYLPDLGRDDAGFFFRPAEQQLLAYALISMIQGDIRQVDRVQALLVQDVRSLSDRFKGPQSPELQAYADALAPLSPPRLMHAQWGISKILGL